MHKLNAWMLVLFAFLAPFGVWGLGALALVDSALFPIPVSMDGVLIGYVATNHKLFLLYCLMAAAASALGALVPYYVGRAGGELFLLKRINRERYERLRDRFENQEFLAIMIPAMLTPPTPIKVFEFAAGVFEMRPTLFATAIFHGQVPSIPCLRPDHYLLRSSTRTRTHRYSEAPRSPHLVGVRSTAGNRSIWFSRKLFAKNANTGLSPEDAYGSHA